MERKIIISRKDLFFATLLFFLSFALYIRTLVPNLLTADAAEFQTLSYTLGMTHPSGYTTFIFLGKLFTLIPISNIAYRVNLMSAFFGALAVGQVYIIIRKLGGWKTATTAGALAGAVGLMLNPLFWRRTIFAETYAPSASMIAGIFLFLLLWEESKRARFLFLAGLLGGLSIGIHSTVVMTASAVLVYMMIKARRRVDWISAASGATLGLLLFFLAFLYLDQNNPPSSIYNTTYITNLSTRGLTPADFDTPIERLLAIFPARSFWTYYFSASPEVIRARLSEYINFYPRWEFALIVAGAIVLFFNKKYLPEAVYLLIAFTLVWGFALTVSFGVYQEFYCPVAVFVYIWLGVGASAIMSGVAHLLKRVDIMGQKQAHLMATLLGVAVVAGLLIHAKADINLAIHEKTTTFIIEEKIHAFTPTRYVRLSNRLLNKVEDDAIVFEIWDRLYTHVYTAHILNGRTGIAFHEIFPSLGQTTLDYIEANIDERPIYFATLHPEIADYYDLEEVGDGLYRLSRK
ncbi:MAG TPA: DUF2723 domain-containing protein [Anaerolineales bacterium]|nr:DUF2723 domain-containing protein [Anaerolineales bacterium]